MNTIKNLFSACVPDNNIYKKNYTPPAEYLSTLKFKYPGEFAKIGDDILAQFTNNEVYMFINYIFEYTINDTYEAQYMLIPEDHAKTKQILFGLNLFREIYELKKKHIQKSGNLPKIKQIKCTGLIKCIPAPNILEIKLQGVAKIYEVVTNGNP